ncbi:unnamed protein product [Rotaria socialis]|uniref:Uncharacterized protein n=1 Tax=Rotaria socialis TaxID=392032 RepID=A0A817SKD4_9BILA|nr:unnamed protein product [Rotaria socialis]
MSLALSRITTSCRAFDRKSTLNGKLVFIIVFALYFALKLQSVKQNSAVLGYNETKRSSGISESSSLTLCTLVRIDGTQIPYLLVLILGLHHAGFDHVRIYILPTDEHLDALELSGTIKTINKIVKREDFITLLNLGTPSKDDFGYKLTDLALMYLYDQYARLPSKCDYILITNGDNLYSSFLGSKLKTHLLARKDIVAWDFISHYERVNLLQADSLEKGTNYEIFDDGTAKCLPISLIPGHFDLGAAVYRLAFLRHYALQFRYPDGSYDSWSDGYFMARASGYTNATVLIRQTLLIHQ